MQSIFQSRSAFLKILFHFNFGEFFLNKYLVFIHFYLVFFGFNV